METKNGVNYGEPTNNGKSQNSIQLQYETNSNKCCEVNKKSWRGRERGIKQIVSKKCVHIKEILLLMDKKDNMLGGIYIYYKLQVKT